MIQSKTLDFVLDENVTQFLEAMPSAIVVVNRKAFIVMVNQQLEEMFGHVREELVGKKIELIIPHSEGFFVDPNIPSRGEMSDFVGLKKDGSEFVAEVSTGAFATDNENLVICIVSDMTFRKKFEAKFQNLLESAPDGIVVVDADGMIVIVNSESERLFNYTRKELIGQPIEILVPNRYKEGHINYRNGYVANPHTRPMGAGRLLSGRKKNGAEFPVEISLSPLKTDQGVLVTAIIRDITERREFEDKIKASLAEKEVLLKEIHHRVKNNLQITSSLLRLQSDFIKDEKVKGLFNESQNRILSMALIHEKLYQSNDLSKIKLLDYIEGLSILLFRSYGVDTNKIKLSITGDQVFLSMDTAVPCGLIINELLSNSFKHAFIDRNEGQVQINIAEDENKVVKLMFVDNGRGFPSGFDFEKITSLGLQMVKNLVKQLNGEVHVKNAGGVEYTISFTELAGKK